ncbi:MULTISPECIES: hypothetical protein [unclassified Myroides]|uniref:hypothetical protein n=1 Tax=unclassified Myroides TaxID=2642485 RepID=UPI0015F926C6|nr:MULTISPECIES: hypothetical protein [unclassified Myroides]MBB1149858.1 hypothetical protein [Myroides sp. NP-2]MDM1408500.1 hypothetical protein [Myroides sp. DF42-4-2]
MKNVYFQSPRVIILSIFAVIFGILIWFVSTDYYIKKEYLIFRQTAFKATVQDKLDKNPTKANTIYLHNGPELRIQRTLFDQLTIGDSVLKKTDSDSIYFKTANGIIIDDYNRFQREKYQHTLK